MTLIVFPSSGLMTAVDVSMNGVRRSFVCDPRSDDQIVRDYVEWVELMGGTVPLGWAEVEPGHADGEG